MWHALDVTRGPVLIGALTTLLATPALAEALKSLDTGSSSYTSLESIVSSWPSTARRAARAMISRYGPPAEVSASRLVWNDNGPWKRTVVDRQEVLHNFPFPHVDVLEQVVTYRVPPDKFDDIAAFDGSLSAERTRGELSSRSETEEMNFLASGDTQNRPMRDG